MELWPNPLATYFGAFKIDDALTDDVFYNTPISH